MDYSKKVVDHFINPRNAREIEDANGVGTVGNARCGDIMRVFLKIEDGYVTDASFKTFGCGAAVATSSIATEMVIGKRLEEAIKITNQDVVDALDGLPTAKVHCSVLAREALHAALWDFAQREGVVIEGLSPPEEHHEH